MTRIAAAAIVIAGMTGLFTSIGPVSSSAAFAQVQEAIQKVRSVTFDVTSQSAGRPDNRSRVLVLGADRVRVETEEEFIVHDAKAQESLIVKDGSQRAIVIKGSQPGTTAVAGDLYSTLRTIHAKSTERLPSRVIDGNEAPGYRVADDRQVLNIWVNPATNLPVLIESTRSAIEGAPVSETARNFVFDAALDESLFSTKPPAESFVETREYPKQPGPEVQKGALVLTPQEGLGPAKFGMTKDETIRALGRPDLTQTDSNGRETFRYDSRGFWLGFDEEGRLRRIACHAHPEHAAPVARTFAGTLAEVIAMGASIGDVTEEYGDPNMREDRSSRFGKTTTMSYWNLGLEFSFREDALCEIDAFEPKASVP